MSSRDSKLTSKGLLHFFFPVGGACLQPHRAQNLKLAFAMARPKKARKNKIQKIF
jgi:hypothetical protein